MKKFWRGSHPLTVRRLRSHRQRSESPLRVLAPSRGSLSVSPFVRPDAPQTRQNRAVVAAQFFRIDVSHVAVCAVRSHGAFLPVGISTGSSLPLFAYGKRGIVRSKPHHALVGATSPDPLRSSLPVGASRPSCAPCTGSGKISCGSGCSLSCARDSLTLCSPSGWTMPGIRFCSPRALSAPCERAKKGRFPVPFFILPRSVRTP